MARSTAASFQILNFAQALRDHSSAVQLRISSMRPPKRSSTSYKHTSTTRYCRSAFVPSLSDAEASQFTKFLQFCRLLILSKPLSSSDSHGSFNSYGSHGSHG